MFLKFENNQRVVMRWSEDTTVKFVGLYKDHECLWDSANINYRNKLCREAAYNTIVEQMGIEGFGVLEAKQKVKNLQSTYSQELKKIEKSKKLGAESWEVYVPSLKWFNLMDGILRNVKEKNIASKNKSEPNEFQLTEIKTEEPEEPPPRMFPCEVSIHEVEEDYAPKPHKRAKTSSEDNMREAFNLMKSVNEAPARDEYTVYGEHIANKLRNCGRSKLEVAIAQHYIDEICFKLTMGEYFQQSFANRHDTFPGPSRNEFHH